jgi:hypothetical protein
MMNDRPEITCLFVDIGGVLLTNGWDHHTRKRAAANFQLEWADMEDRHHPTLDTYEEGKITLKEYFVDLFISSCFVYLRKPDTDIFRLALNIAQVKQGEQHGQEQLCRGDLSHSHSRRGGYQGTAAIWIGYEEDETARAKGILNGTELEALDHQPVNQPAILRRRYR